MDNFKVIEERRIMKKIISLLLSVVMVASIFGATVVSAASDAGLALNPTVKATAVEYATELDMPTYLRVDVTMETATNLTKFNALTGKGLAIRALEVLLAFDEDLFDVSTATIMDDNARFDGGPVSNGTKAAFAATTDAATISDVSDKLFSIYIEAKDSSKAVEDYNKTEFAKFSTCNVTVDQFTGKVSGKVQVAQTSYRTDGNGDAVPTTVVGNGSTPEPSPEPVAPVVSAVSLDPTSAAVKGGETVQFKATVTGKEGSDENGDAVAVPQDVEWTATAGTITADGLFTAPEATDEEQTITVTATAKDTDVKATATVTVAAKEVPPAPQTEVTVSAGTAATAANYENVVYWDVTLKNAADKAIKYLLEDKTLGQKKEDALTIGVDGEGDVEFTFFLAKTAERLNSNVDLTITAGDVSATGSYVK